MNGATAIRLPMGAWREAAFRRDAELRPLTGEDEEALLEARRLLPAERDTLLLARCVTRLDGRAPEPDDLRTLTIGDRQALLIWLRRISLGDTIQSTVRCPACHDQLDVDLALPALLLAEYDRAEPVAEVALGERTLGLRALTGADQEDAARLGDVWRGVALLLERCTSNAQLTEAERSAIGDALARLDPQAEIALDLTCAACQQAFGVLFDAGAFLARELSTEDRLYREVHALASHYHWSERDILALTIARRRRYLRLIGEEGVPA